jgi:hypothetical protein
MLASDQFPLLVAVISAAWQIEAKSVANRMTETLMNNVAFMIGLARGCWLNLLLRQVSPRLDVVRLMPPNLPGVQCLIHLKQ